MTTTTQDMIRDAVVEALDGTLSNGELFNARFIESIFDAKKMDEKVEFLAEILNILGEPKNNNFPPNIKSELRRHLNIAGKDFVDYLKKISD